MPEAAVMRDKIRWAIHSTGHMAAKLVPDLRLLPDAEVTAVVSRSAAAAGAFAGAHGIPRAVTDPASLAGAVDIAHIATPAPQHAEVALRYLDLGIPVLVEKPFATSRADAERVLSAARASGVFAMEAMWTRFLPGIRAVAGLVASGGIGVPLGVTASFGRPGPFAAGHRLRRPDLGGGALLDMGIYPLSLAHLLLGGQAAVTASAVRGAGGVDDATTVVLAYPAARALLHCSIAGPAPNAALVTGSEGQIALPADFIAARASTVIPARGEPRTTAWPRPGWGYQFQAAEAHRCLRAGLGESPLLPHAATIEVMRLLDLARAQVT
jgi:predicted dehydrogenase